MGRLEGDQIRGFSGTPPGWEKPVEDLVLDGARSRDIVAHEAGHAALSGVKPGLSHGMSMALNEAVADTIGCLTAFDDPDVTARVLAETGGDLSQPNEATRIAEVIGEAKHRYGDDDPANDDQRYIRSLHSDLTLDDLNLERDQTDLPGMGMAPSRDPHKVGHVISGGLYELFTSLYEDGKAAGKAPEEAIAEAKDVVGTLAMRATRHVGEHNVSFRDYALSMVKIDRELYGGAHEAQLRAAFEKRKLIDPGEDLGAALQAREKKLPEFVLPGDVKDPAEVMAQIEAFEQSQVARVKAAETREEREAVLLLRHNPYIPDVARIQADELSVLSDDTADDGVRVVRLRYKTDPPGAFGEVPEEHMINAYKSLVFDKDGRLIDAHFDIPRGPDF